LRSTTSANRDTKSRILDAAEELFAADGFAATSLRSITGRAEVNLAAVHYHFGSKESLVEAVFSRRLRPLNDERLELLEACEAGGGGLDETLRALIGPALRLAQSHSNDLVMRLLGRMFSEPGEKIQRIFTEQFREIALRFTAALRAVLPDLPAPEFFWRVHFTIGAMAHTMVDTHRIKFLSGGKCDPGDVEGNIDRLVTFVGAGFQAAPTSEGNDGGAR
jgi:AcrR family transcriptional regulator